jgi:hypothetical protein
VSQGIKMAMLPNGGLAPSTSPEMMSQMQQQLAATQKPRPTYNMTASALHPMQPGSLMPGTPPLGHAIATGKLGVGPGTGLFDSQAETEPKLASDDNWLARLLALLDNGVSYATGAEQGPIAAWAQRGGGSRDELANSALTGLGVGAKNAGRSIRRLFGM